MDHSRQPESLVCLHHNNVQSHPRQNKFVCVRFKHQSLVLQVTDSCKQYGGFYLGSVGGAAAVLAEDCIKKVEAEYHTDSMTG